MEPELDSLLRELERGGQAHDAQEMDHAARLLNLERPTAELVSLLLRASGARRVLEVGTSNGYSTLWIAWAIRPHGGRVVSIERAADKQAQAKANLERAGLADAVDLRTGDATEIVRGLEGEFDAVFFDADRRSAPEQLALLLPRLTPRCLLMADNVLSHPQEIAGYLAAVEALPNFQRTVVPVGKGLSVACRGAEA